MEHKQPSNEQVVARSIREERAKERKTWRLRLDALEERVAPNAIWGE